MEEIQRKGKKRPHQRFEQCLLFLQRFMRPSLEALSAVNYYDQSVQQSATELVQLAVDDAIEEIGENEKIGKNTKNEISEKLKSTKLWVMFPEEILNLTKIDELYNEFVFDGSETYFEIYVGIQIHNWKLQLKRKDSWLTILHKINPKENNPTYFFNQNVLSECK